MNVYYVSDLHLRSSKDKVATHFVEFLKTVPQRGDTFVLGGDIFDLYVGDKKVFRKNFAKIISAIRELDSRGCCVYYLEGNHDFHLGNVFRHQRNILIKEDDFEIRLGNKSFWISHGDQIDRKDYGYLFLRGLTRSTIFQLVTQLMPDVAFDELGRWSSKTSRKYTSTIKMKKGSNQRLRDLFLKFATKKVQEGYDFVFVGHSHLADDVDIKVGKNSGRYLNLGFSDTHLTYGHFSAASDSLKVKKFPG